MNCLLTTLKEEINNPNLPIIETMEQFTLNAITASGNNSMTDAQKWALNHFFIRIGAIDNTGIYNKLYVLYMPLICNQNAQKAFVDYKGSNSKTTTDNPITFDGLGVISNFDASHTTKTAFTIASSIPASVESFSVAGLGNIASSGSMGTQSCLRLNNTAIANQVGVTSALQGFFGIKRFQHSGREEAWGFVGSRRASDSYSWSMIVPNAVYNDDYTITDNGSALPTSGYDLKLSVSQAPTSLFALTTTALTEAEEATFADALRGLRAAFPDPVSNG